MKYLVSILLLLSLSFTNAQNWDSLMNSFIRVEVLGDTVDLSTVPERLTEIDTAFVLPYLQDFLLHSYVDKHRVEGEILHLTIPLDSFVVDTAFFMSQVEKNNQFHWKELDTSYFSQIKPRQRKKRKRKKSRAFFNYSLPIFLSENQLIILYRYHYDGTYGGLTLDFWELKEEKWVKTNWNTIMMY